MPLRVNRGKRLIDRALVRIRERRAVERWSKGASDGLAPGFDSRPSVLVQVDGDLSGELGNRRPGCRGRRHLAGVQSDVHVECRCGGEDSRH